MNRLLILLAFLLTLLSVTPAFADNYEDSDETAKVDWSGSPFFTLFPSDCRTPTKQCLKKIDSYAKNHWVAWTNMNNHQEMGIWVDCIMKVEDMKRHRAILKFAKDNPSKWRFTTPQLWALAVGKNFGHCSVKK